MGGNLRRRLAAVRDRPLSDLQFAVSMAACVGTVLLAVWLVMTAVHGHLGFFRPSDDGYYYYDLARGVADGRGLSTDGLHSTNGFHPLWFLVLLPFGVLTTGPVGLVVVAQLLSIVLLAAAVGGVVATARRLGAGRLAAAVGGLALTVAPWRGVAAAGVEGALALALLSWLAYAAVGAAEAAPGRFRPWAVTGLLAALTMLARLDTVFVVGGIVLALLVTSLGWRPGRPPSDRPRQVGPTLALLVPPLALLGGYLLLNTVTTGRPMPITAALKSSFPEPDLSVAFIRSHAEYYVALVPAWVAVVVAASRFPRHLAILVAAAAGASLFAVYLTLFGHGVFWWHFVSLLPAGALGTALVLDWCLELPILRERRSLAVGLATAGTAAVLVLPLVVSVLASNPDGTRAAASGWRVEAYEAATWAGAHLPDDSLLAMKDSGAFGYYAPQPVMNLDGVVSDRDYNQRICDGSAQDEMGEAGVEYVAQHSVPADYETFEVALPCWEDGDYSSQITLSRQHEVYRSRPYWHGGPDRIFVIWAFEPEGADEEADAPPVGADQPTTADDGDPAVDRTLSGEESFPDGFTVPAGEVWELDPDVSTTVASEANVVVEGELRMRPSDPEVVHTLRFENVDESLVVGADADADHDHHDSPVVDTDVGLWVIGDGRLDLEGSEKAAWNRSGTDPTWQPGDEVRVTPTEAGDSTSFAEFEPGDEVPTVSYAEETYAAEVLNLTRNVRIQGTGDGEADPADNGRAHIWINSTQPQTIRFAELAHLGPRHLSDDDPTEGVLGRYPLHFHQAGSGSDGSLVEGVVVRDSGNHAFVPHGSHGITIRDTIAYNVFDSAYWWDPDDTGHGGPAENVTNDLSIEHALAAQVRWDPAYRGFLISGFVLGEGENVSVVDSVAVGVQGNNTASGFHWPATANGNEHNVWGFSGNVAHNNAVDGIFVWQNDGNDHLVEDFVGYHNGAFGVDHGAYGNNYTYDGLVLFGNGEAGIRSKAAATDRPQTWRNVDTDSILIADRALDASAPTVFEDVILRGPVLVDEAGDTPSGGAVYEFRDVRTAEGDELSADDFDVVHQVSEITVHLDDGATLEVD